MRGGKGMLSARESLAGLLDFGFVESGFQSPDPDNHELTARSEPAAPKSSLRIATFHATKRSIDLVVSGTLLVLLSPVLLMLGALVRLTSRGPAIFSQERLTEGGRVFRDVKFRSMRADAEEASGPMWAEEDDPRVTTFGGFPPIFASRQAAAPD